MYIDDYDYDDRDIPDDYEDYDDEVRFVESVKLIIMLDDYIEEDDDSDDDYYEKRNAYEVEVEKLIISIMNDINDETKLGEEIIRILESGLAYAEIINFEAETEWDDYDTISINFRLDAPHSWEGDYYSGDYYNPPEYPEVVYSRDEGFFAHKTTEDKLSGAEQEITKIIRQKYPKVNKVIIKPYGLELE